MKKRKLFLSLICSIILTVALATFTIISIVPKKNADNTPNAGNVSENVSQESVDINADRDGSAEKPYLIASAEDFSKYIGSYGYIEVKPVKVPEMVDSVDEAGNPIKVEKTDENGEVVYIDKVDEEGNVIYNDTCYFELAGDVDFAGVDYVSLFNQDKAFNGHLNGKGFALKNISINVSKDNLDSFIYKNEANKNRYDAKIAIFGAVENAEIIDIKVENIKVDVADEVYNYAASGKFFTDHEQNAMNDIKVATVAAVARDSKLQVAVSGEVKAGGYTLVLGNEPENNSVVGGVVGLAVRTTFENTTANVKFTASNNELNENYFVGGIAGQAYNVTVKGANVALEASTSYTKEISIGGMFGYVKGADVAESAVSLNVKENAARGNFRTTGNKGFDYKLSTWVAGIAPKMTASETAAVKIENVKIVSNVELDAVYAGAVVEVIGTASFKNVIVNSNVDVLEAFGFARYLGTSTLAYDEETFEVDEESTAYNIKLTGKVILNNAQDSGNEIEGSKATGSIAVSAVEKNLVVAGGAANIKIVLSDAIYNKLIYAEKKAVDRLANVVIY